MAERLTRNVSLPAHQNAFVEAMVAGGRYRTASEVVREGLRLLEEAEHRRLLEAWLLEELRGDDLKWESLVAEGGAGLPEGLVERARAQVRAVLEQVGVGQVDRCEVERCEVERGEVERREVGVRGVGLNRLGVGQAS